ncbi:hypothetical protein BJY01DRAFT_59274 [Aspergillus pseudoustus]|uniref:Uncharacterized protein n=1 Tax=Aspergillus pseudoustus TaxID=1810923 RepID=A0ABR4J8D1_9EURO
MPPSLASTSTRSSQSDKKTSSGSTLSGKSDDLAIDDDAPPAFSLGSIQHLDRQGKVIADPDRSNPTRPRMERPLDTIRGFEAAIASRRGGHVA